MDHAKTFLVVLWIEGATGRFTRHISLKFHYSKTWWIPLKLCFLIFPLTWYDCYANQQEDDGFQGWHKDFLLGQQITKTIVLNVGSNERDKEGTTGSFDNDVSFKVDDWKAIEECALGLGRLNLEDELHQDEQN